VDDTTSPTRSDLVDSCRNEKGRRRAPPFPQIFREMTYL
jgi:hypothetical protein